MRPDLCKFLVCSDVTTFDSLVNLYRADCFMFSYLITPVEVTDPWLQIDLGSEYAVQLVHIIRAFLDITTDFAFGKSSTCYILDVLQSL